jgi:hypothetical protein
MNQNFTTEELASAVDELAQIKARISDLTQREGIYKAFLIASERPAIEGTLHQVTVTSSIRTATDWETIARQALAKKPELLETLIEENTTTGAPFFTVRVSARKAAQ